MHARDWADIQEPRIKPVYDAVLARAGVGRGTRYLDVGCGAGLAVHLAAQRGASVFGVDASEAFLEVARERTPQGDFRIADLEKLPFADQSFDVVTGFNSFQYAADHVAALREARRVAAKGGQIIVMTWGDPEGIEVLSIVNCYLSFMPPSSPATHSPFSLSDEKVLREVVTAAGLRTLEIFEVECPFDYPNEETARRGFASTGIAGRAIEVAGEAAVFAAQTKAFAPFKRADGSIRLGAWFRCLLAQP